MTLEKKLKGVILAGGTGSRLLPLTRVTNKHLVAVGDYPMIEYPLATLQKIGITNITVVTGREHAGAVMDYLAQEHPEISFTYKVQKEAGGIAQALALAQDAVEGYKIAVILGDNVYANNFSAHAHDFLESGMGAMLFLKSVSNPQRFGVAEVKEGKVVNIEEKPKEPKSNLAVTGLYFYDTSVFEKIRLLKPSSRGELEVTDVNLMYVGEKRAACVFVEDFWSDAGTRESRRHTEEYVWKSGYKPVHS